MKEHEPGSGGVGQKDVGRSKPAPVRILVPFGPRSHRRQWPDGTREAAVCGEAEVPVRRGTAAFESLLVYDNPAVVVKDEEGTGADRRVTRRLRDCLDTLAGLVLAEWPRPFAILNGARIFDVDGDPGVRLRVTEAWDEQGEHSGRSLHYEGRAADMTTSDRDPRKLPRLGGLATEAGFDWVLHEGDHIHASVRRDPPVEG